MFYHKKLNSNCNVVNQSQLLNYVCMYVASYIILHICVQLTVVTALYIPRMMNVLIYLIILTSQCVHSKVIIVNSNNGNDNTECCVNGTCTCSSLSTALLNIDNNTIINITSESVALNNTTTMGSGKLTNITITGSNVTIMCNNSGSVYCESCDDVMIEGITWDRCGDPNVANIAGVTFNGTSNISIVNCTFQHSQIPTVSLLGVLDKILIQNCKFLFNIPVQVSDSWSGGILSIIGQSGRLNNSNVTLIICQSYFYNNGYLHQFTLNQVLSTLYVLIHGNSVPNCDVILEKNKFISNRNAAYMEIAMYKLISIQLTEISLLNNSFLYGYVTAGIDIFIPSSDHVVLSIMSSNFNANNGNSVWCDMIGNKISIRINDSNITNSALTLHPQVVSSMMITVSARDMSEITFYRVQCNDNLIGSSQIDSIFHGAVSIVTFNGNVKVRMYMLDFMSNKYLGRDGGALFILLKGQTNNYFNITVEECLFAHNWSPGHGAALYISTEGFSNSSNNIQIKDTNFDQNFAGSSVVCIVQDGFTQGENKRILQLNTLTFTSNVGSSMYISSCNVKMLGNLLFNNNTAENGGAMYLSQVNSTTIENESKIKFLNNTAKLNGGAVYVDFICNNFNDNTNRFFYNASSSYSVSFINNSATIAGNSIYFNVPNVCSLNANINTSNSIFHIPCQFNYSQLVNGKMMNIPCDLDYTLLNGTGAPIVTSPHELRLYFPFNDGYNISSISDPNVYFVKNNILGHPVKFTGAVFDYFGKPTVPTLFSVQLQHLSNKKFPSHTLIGSVSNHILTKSVDNFTILNITFKGKKVDIAHINLSVIMTPLTNALNNISTVLVVELVPCIDHPGYTYNKESQTCVCYHHIVKCNDDGNEIKRGYWFGSISNETTTSLCPNHYCNFTDRKQTSEGYFELPITINAQCNDHRVGRACGKCSSGYTLSYDSTDCISIDQCGIGWTVLVITLTCLYWIAVVAGVFSLMYFKFQISSGYLYGLIYYYSMVGILLNNNPYVSDDAFQFVSVLSSFAQLTPQFLGKLCFVNGLSGIDQLFIHYSHAVGVSLLLLLIVVAARCSARISLFVSRCIIRVICLLILLSYTSIASTSLQLLLPLKFTDVKEWYTYSSPHTEYFQRRHAIYGVVAIICELVVIGLSLLLLLEPVLSRKINFIKIKPLLDQLQGCYKDKYRCFAAYYLICRQVIFLIVYIFNSNYSNMLFYLQTACVVAAMIHMWFQPYQSELLNALDGVTLLVMVLLVNINTFTSLHNGITEISLILVILPLLLFCTISIKNIVHTCVEKKHRMWSSGSHTCRYRQIDIAGDHNNNENAEQCIVLR